MSLVTFSLDLAALSIVACIVAFLLASLFASKFKQFGLTGLDVHKPDRPEVAEMGGLAVLAGVFAALPLAFIFYGSSIPPVFVAGFVTVVAVGVIGILDDMLNLRQRYKPFLVAAASFPLAFVLLGRTSVMFPLIGPVPFGLLYPLLVVPLAITTSANFSNMLAGFNGLEVGCAVISIATLTLLASIRGSLAGAMLGVLFLGGFLGLLALNWYPSRIFPGDTGTLTAGAAIASIGLMSQLEFAAVMVSIPAGLDFALKMLSKNRFSARSVLGNTQVTADGILQPPNYPALSHAFMRLSNLTEKGLVDSLLVMQCAYAALAFVFTVGLL
ncbi:MAG TPA: hypothetical protein VFF30_12550 [Nitrososphaerales archaeon]|nr:hypothetical protein [Nitrososphaerales archaeon]